MPTVTYSKKHQASELVQPCSQALSHPRTASGGKLGGASLVPRPLPDFISQPIFFQRLRDKIWEWPGDEARVGPGNKAESACSYNIRNRCGSLSWKIWTPPKMDPPVQIFRNIWTPMELIFQELDEIFRLPLKFLDPPLQRVNNLF